MRPHPELKFYRAVNFLLITVFGTFISCQQADQNQPPEGTAVLADYPIQPVDIRQVKLTDQFWLPIVERLQENHHLRASKCTEEGRLDNFLIAGGKKKVPSGVPCPLTIPISIRSLKELPTL